ncbi:MAG TPA: cytochrome P450 [Gaiellaceae bacterium]
MSGSNGNGVAGLLRFGRDSLGYLDSLRADEREIVPFRLGSVEGHLLTRPEHIQLALESEDWPPLSRGRLAALTKWYSGGLILTEGAEHHRQRDGLWKPLVDDEAILAIAVARTARRADAWAEGQPFEVFTELRSLCWSIDWEAIMSADLDRTPELLAAQERGVAALVWLLGPFGAARWGWPLPGSARTRAARRRLDAAIGEGIVARRAHNDGPADLLAQLVRLADADGVTDDELICASVKQWLGADQLGAHLTWTLHLLAENPDVEAQWHAELDDVLGARAPTAADLPALPVTRKVVHESLRLFPPIWGFFRQVTGDFRIGDEVIPTGHVIAFSQWFTHRDPRLWPDPQRFDPERWAEGAPRPPAVSYFPYSAGPYGCPAHATSLKEASLVLATLGRRWTFRPDGGRPTRPAATGAIVPKGGLRMTPAARA